GELDVVYRFLHGQRAVEQDIDVDGRRDLLAKARQQLQHGLGYLDGVGARLLAYPEDDGALDAAGVATPRGCLVVLDAVEHTPDVRDTDGGAIAVSHHEWPIAVCLIQLAVGLDRKRLAPTVERSGGK